MEKGKPRAKNRQVERTKGWIRDALFGLMEEKAYNDITVQDITEKANIARPTFYYNYDDKDAVALEFIEKCLDITIVDGSGAKRIVLTLHHSYVSKNVKMLQRFSEVPTIRDRVEHLFIDEVKQSIEKLPEGRNDDERAMHRYKMYYQLGGVLGVIAEWYGGGEKMPINDFADLLNSMARPNEPRYRNVPTVVVRVE
jgi:AcrR family transcriptional regulator